MPAGLDSTGFTVKLLTEILQEIQISQANTIDPALDFSTEKALGQLNGIFSEREALLWELVHVAMSAFDPDVAEGYLLEALSAITGTVRRPASRSLVPVSVNLDASTTLPAGSRASVVGQPTKVFRTVADIPATTAGDYPGQMESEDTGPVAAASGTLTIIAGPVAGWNSVTNTSDATVGRVQDTDTTLRLRRVEGLARAGACTSAAIRADLLAIEDIEKVHVFENLTDVTDGDGIPAHSLEILVFDGIIPTVDDDVIAQAIWDTKGPIRTYGSDSGTAVDSEGMDQIVYFTRPTVLNVWIEVIVDTEGVTPVGAEDLLTDRLVTVTNESLLMGVDVIALALKCTIMDTKKDLGYTWVNDVTSLLLGFSDPPTLGLNLAITPRQIARLDTARTTITIA